MAMEIIQVAFATGASALNAAADMAGKVQTLAKGSKADPELLAQIIQLQLQLIKAGTAQNTLQRQLNEAQDEARRLDRFEAEAARFALKKMLGGSVVWSLTQPKEGEPEQLLCTRCYEDRKISRLQPSDYVHYRCPICATEFDVNKSAWDK